MDEGRTRFWTRVVADERFRDAIIDDPLRAIAEVDDIEVSPEQVRRLEDMSREERSDLVLEIVRTTFVRNAIALYGPVAMDGPPPPIPGEDDRRDR